MYRGRAVWWIEVLPGRNARACVCVCMCVVWEGGGGKAHSGAESGAAKRGHNMMSCRRMPGSAASTWAPDHWPRDWAVWHCPTLSSQLQPPDPPAAGGKGDTAAAHVRKEGGGGVRKVGSSAGHRWQQHNTGMALHSRRGSFSCQNLASKHACARCKSPPGHVCCLLGHAQVRCGAAQLRHQHRSGTSVRPRTVRLLRSHDPSWS